MARNNIGLGSAANDGTGDTLRGAGTKINNNFVELYQKLGGDSNNLSGQIAVAADGLVFEGTIADNNETTLKAINPTADRNISLPNASGSVILDSATQTLINKTLTSPVLTTPQLNNIAATFQYVFKPAAISADRNVNFPALSDSDTFVFASEAATLKNKTLDSATVNNPIFAGTVADVNGAGLLEIISTASAVNDLKLSNAATNTSPTITADGTDTNVGIAIVGKAKGSVQVSKSAVSSTTQTAAGDCSETTGFIIANSGTALAIGLPNGTTIGEMKVFTNKGSGLATITPANFAQGSTVALSQFDAVTLIWDGTNWYITGHYGAAIA